MYFKFILGSVLFYLVAGNHLDVNNHNEPIPYNFGYAVQSHDGAHFRREQGNGHGQVRGTYGYTDPMGILREVHYVADQNGFRAEVKTNEPGTISKDPADVRVVSNTHHGFQHFGNHFLHGR